MNTRDSRWLLLIVSFPTTSSTGRMRIWRALKALGCASLRDGAYLLPAKETQEEVLRELADETRREGGDAWLLHVDAQSDEEDSAFMALFARNNEYAELTKVFSEARKRLSSETPQELTRRLRRLKREYQSLRAIDYFPNEASIQAEAIWLDFIDAAEALLSPGEPHQAEGTIKQLNPCDYQRRQWATRSKLWVDRVASAWLIRRFIDKEAHFIWLMSPSDCPADALGFDFDGAAFTHIGERVTFEVLMSSFELEGDPGLVRLGAMVHMLDVGGEVTPEGQGFEAILDGARQRLTDDDRLLEQIGWVLDSLYAHFRQTD